MLKSKSLLKRSRLLMLLCSASLAIASCEHTGQVKHSSSTGGAPGSGGATSTGGAVGSGGATGSGGASETGGAPGAGGGDAFGGNTGSGGANQSGGSSGTGGSSATGGSSGTGGLSGTNLVTNSDFSTGQTDWHLEGAGNLSINNGALCVSGFDTNSLLGWTSGAAPVMLSSGTSYRLSYQASGNGVSMHVKVGLSIAPYTGDFETSPNESLQSNLQSFTHTFTPAQNDAKTGFAFTFPSGNGTVCLDNVTLTAN